MTSGFWAYGSKMKLGDGATSEAFTTIAEVLDISGPGFERDSIEMTNQDSTSGWREYIPGFRDGGELTFDCNWLPTNATQNDATGILETFTDNVNHNWQLLLPDASTLISFAGHITGYDIDLPLEEQGKLSITIKISGVVSIAD